MATLLEALLTKIPSDTEERVDRTKTRLNQAIREALRRETGIGLAQKDEETQESIGVRIHLVPGLPASLRHKEITEKDRLAALLAPWRQVIVDMYESLKIVETELFDVLLKNSLGESLLTGKEQSIRTTREFAETILKQSQTFDLVKWILEVDEDILGAYFYRVAPKYEMYSPSRTVARIELYWGVIGLVAQTLGVAVEDLTTVVLSHELSHAYTHLGADIDGHRWASNHFANSDHPLKEGLAQYYTALVCKRLVRYAPSSFDAYEKLLKHQPEAYKSHEPWIKNFTPEEVRFGMLETRRIGKGSIASFQGAMAKARTTLRQNSNND